MNSNENTFGKRFKKLRNEMGLTQKELVKLFNKKYYYNFNTSSISMYENEKQIPEIDVLNKWADFFNVSLDYLVGRTDVRNQSEKISNAVEDDPELIEFWNELKEREDLQLLFKQTKNLSPKDIKQIIRIIKAIEDEEDMLDQ
ncbi:MAG TPA: helix-turn-helix transcriptional regulator [Tissierellia bacterium]|nr:helix-turn-helix transcriptional regulator [Tissierellia bacterium]